MRSYKCMECENYFQAESLAYICSKECHDVSAARFYQEELQAYEEKMVELTEEYVNGKYSKEEYIRMIRWEELDYCLRVKLDDLREVEGKVRNEMEKSI